MGERVGEREVSLSYLVSLFGQINCEGGREIGEYIMQCYERGQ